MGVLGNNIRLGASAAADYEIEKSLRFNKADSAVLTYTPSGSTGGSFNKLMTFSFWAKRGSTGGNSYTNYIWTAWNGSNTDRISFTSDDQIQVELKDGTSTEAEWHTDRIFKDTTSWYHIVVAFDTTQSTTDDRLKLYVNGTLITLYDLKDTVGQNYDLKGFNTTYQHSIGRYQSGASSGNTYFDGYLAEVHFIDGLQKDASDFGKINPTTGQWVPKKYDGVHGTRGFYLDFSDNSGTTATTLGKDSSANSNNVTPSNFSVAAGTGCDSMTDTPTNNFCTLNFLENGYGTTTYSNGNLDVAASNAWVPMRGTMSVKSGKYYWEVYGADGNSFIGVAKDNTDIRTINPMLRDGVIVYYGSDGKKRIDGTFTTYGSAYGNTNVIGVALDIDNGKLYFAEDNTWQNSGDPTSGSTGTGAINLSDSTGLVGSQITPFFCKNGNSFQVNFGQRAFTHTPPTGYQTLCTANLPTPTIKDGTKHFKTVLYTGNATSRNIVSDFDTGFVWIKRRSGQEGHVLSNIVVGANNFLSSNSTAAQNTASNCVTAFNSDGVTVGTQGIVNDNGQTFVSWHWKAGGSGSTNTDGSVDTTVSVNSAAGISIVRSTNSSVTSGFSTFGHGLSVAPTMIICKPRIDVTDNWKVYHKGLTANENLMLQSDGMPSTYSNYINDVTATTFKMHAGGNPNDDLLAYCFSDVEGFSKCGLYEGNGGSDGTFVYTGFRPAYVVTKRVETSGSAYWNIFDSARDPYNSGETTDFKRLRAESDSAEAVNHTNYTPPDFVANGFKLRHGRADTNYDDKKFIYFAFAESPFKYANAR